MKQSAEQLGRGLLLSVGLHAVLAVTVVMLPGIFPLYGIAGWGSEDAGAEGINVKIVSSIAGIPLPAAARVNETAAANESAGFFESESPPVPLETAPTEVPAEEAERVPETMAPVETTPTPPPASPTPREDSEPLRAPDNAVPFGQGGRPAISYGQFTGDGTGAIAVGDGSFGERYGRYVEAINRRISENWLQSMIAANVGRAPRIYVTFDILRDGTIMNEEIEESSGIPSLDRSAMRAIFASNPLAPLPRDFRGRSVSVRFWFEYN